MYFRGRPLFPLAKIMMIFGCNSPPRDDVGFPRLTWASLSISKHGSYCTNAVSMPSYESWKFYHRSHVSSSDWERDFQRIEKKHSWNSKLRKRRYMQTVDDLVDCNAWSVIDWSHGQCLWDYEIQKREMLSYLILSKLSHALHKLYHTPILLTPEATIPDCTIRRFELRLKIQILLDLC